MEDIPGYADFLEVVPVDKGWSDDKKYRVRCADGQMLLLRLADVSAFARRQAEFTWMQRIAARGVAMSQPLGFGLCCGGTRVYTKLSWCAGEDAEVALARLSEAEQYALGLRAGVLLREIHAIPAPASQEAWEPRFNRKMDTKIAGYQACGLRFEGDMAVLRYIEEHRGLLCGRPQCLQHGDYHIGNMIVSAEGALSAIDFNRMDYGDPWEEFNRIVWSAAASPLFASGQINGYFDGQPPASFFQLLALYIASNTLSSIYWAIPFGQAELETMRRQAGDVLRWFDGMQNPVPTWYISPNEKEGARHNGQDGR